MIIAKKIHFGDRVMCYHQFYEKKKKNLVGHNFCLGKN